MEDERVSLKRCQTAWTTADLKRNVPVAQMLRNFETSTTPIISDSSSISERAVVLPAVSQRHMINYLKGKSLLFEAHLRLPVDLKGARDPHQIFVDFSG